MSFAAQAEAWDLDYLAELNAMAPIDPPPRSIAKWIQGLRLMPTSTPFPGAWDNARTPFWIEMMDDMSPSSPIHHEVNMKAAQMGATAVLENIIAFYIGACPSQILYVSATENLLKRWGIRLEPLIDSCGLRHLIASQSAHSKSRKSGDLMLSKEFIGGNLFMASANSAPSLRSDTVRILARDEIDGAPVILVTGEGGWLGVSEARTAAWDDRAKIIDNSTPTIDGKSPIQELYKLGDERQFLVPCPRCGKFQILKWGNERTQYGVKPERKAGELIGAYYQCDHCHDAFFNREKGDFLAKGRWEPSSKSCAPNYRSRHISGIYRPIGMKSWLAMQRKYEIALEDQEKMRDFVNLDLGLPYKERGSRPKMDKVIELRGGYRSGTIPDGVLFLTAAIDVQRGSKKDPNNPARLEMEICGHGALFRTWSIMYLRFEGAVDDENDGAWADLKKFVVGKVGSDRPGGFWFQRDDGKWFCVMMTFVDSGDGMTTDVVYKFTAGWDNTFPSKGFSALKKRKGEAEDPLVPGQFHKRYRIQTVGGDTNLVEIGTVLYKNHLYNNLKIMPQDTGDQRSGFCSFPVDYDDKYFRMLTAEEKLIDGSYTSGGRRNEALDCRVMNLCACDVFLAKNIRELKDHFKSHGWTLAQLNQINHTFALDVIRKQTERVVK